jgi:GT2 family glycosyltransferase
MTNQVDVVIPTFNGRELLVQCLDALSQQSASGFRVIVVDDCSTDDTVPTIHCRFPDVTIIRFDRNRGFAAAANAGIAASESEFVALLNNDAIPTPEWLAEISAALERHPRAAAATSKIMLASEPNRIHSAGDTYSRGGVAGNRGVWQVDSGQFDVEEEVFGACAAAALYRRSALDAAARIDGAVFDPDFGMYCEDVDLNWRLRLIGYSIIYAPAAVVYHHLSATGGGPLASYHVARNNVGVIAKNLSRRVIAKNAWRIALELVQSFAGALWHIREPAARARLRGLLIGPAFAFRMRHKRRRIQASRTIPDNEIERLLVP